MRPPRHASAIRAGARRPHILDGLRAASFRRVGVFAAVRKCAFSRSAGCPVMLAIRSKSLSKWRTVSSLSSAVAAMMRSGTDGARCWPRSASKVRTSTARSSIAGVRYSTGIAETGGWRKPDRRSCPERAE